MDLFRRHRRVLLVALTGRERLDPIVAAIVGLNILVTGFRLVSQSVTSLLDAAMPAETSHASMPSWMDADRGPRLRRPSHAESGRHRFISLDSSGSCQLDGRASHALADDVEVAIATDLPNTDVQTHLEPRDHAEAHRRST